MTLAEVGLILTAGGAVLGAVFLAVRERLKPRLDAAQVESIVVNSDAIKQDIAKKAALSNAKRDLRLLKLEVWGFEEVMPWGRDVVTKFDQQARLLQEMAAALDRILPDIRLTPFPEMPPPTVE